MDTLALTAKLAGGIGSDGDKAAVLSAIAARRPYPRGPPTLVPRNADDRLGWR